jgi:hypothetical protein
MWEPELRPVAAACYQQLRLLAPNDEQLGWPLAHFIAAQMGPLEDLVEWTSDTDAGPGYSVFLDIDRCPAIALPWLAQFKGVVIPAGLTEDKQRAWIRSAEGQHRGTVDALERAGQRHLTGTKSVRVLERVGGNAYAMTAVTRTSETPDPAATLADLQSAKRIGMLLTHIVSDEPIVDESTRTINAITVGLDALTVADVT